MNMYEYYSTRGYIVNVVLVSAVQRSEELRL